MISGMRDKKLWVGSAISLVMLFFLFRKIDYGQLATAFRQMDYRLLLPALVSTMVSYWFRAVRWRLLLIPLKATRLKNLFPATIIGYMANNLLPARLGEFVRAYTLARSESLTTSGVFATLVIDRLCDGFSVLLVLVITLFTVRLPPGMEQVQRSLELGGYAVFGIYALAVLFLFALKRWNRATLRVITLLLSPLPGRFSVKCITLIDAFMGGLRMSLRPGALGGVALTSLVIWATAIWPIDLTLRAFGIVLPASASLFIMVFLVFAVMVPASPGYVGTYHAACVYGLTAFTIPKEQALSVALVMHAMNFFPVIFLGLWYLWKANLSLKSIREETGQKES
jgi:glycosyltransferase 2 family protein